MDLIKNNLENLNKLGDIHMKQAYDMYNADKGKAYPMDLIAHSIYNRSLALISGFKSNIEQKNYICAAPLVRLQLDNILRFYATFLVEDSNKLALKFISGIHINKFKDRDTGKNLSDYYLKETLGKHYPWIIDIYDNTSGYIHLSEKHFFNTIKHKNRSDNSIEIKIGAEDKYIKEEDYIETIKVMIELTELLLNFLKQWTEIKSEY